MPQTLAESMAAVLVLGAATAVLMLFAGESRERRRGLFRRRRDEADEAAGTDAQAEDESDEQAEARAADDGKVADAGDTPAVAAVPDTAVEDVAEAGDEEQTTTVREGRRRRPGVQRPELDHVPLEADAVREAGDDAEAGGLVGRFRRGLRKTRDYLNRDVREVMGAGPVPETFDSLEEILVRADIGVATAMALTDELRDRGSELTSETLPAALRDAMRGQLQDADRRLRVNTDGVSVWLVVGVNGTGKTTTCAKLAAHAAAQGFEVCLAAGDTFRAAAIEQLETWAERVGVGIVRQHAGADSAAVVFDAVAHAKARGYDLVIADTAGRLHTRAPLMDELRKVRRVVEREEGLLTETLLVLDATTGQNGIAQAKAFREAVDVTGLVLAKLDGTAKGGIVVAVERELGIPVKAIGVGEKAADLAPFDPDVFVTAIFGDD